MTFASLTLEEILQYNRKKKIRLIQWAIKKCNLLNIPGKGEKSETTKARN